MERKRAMFYRIRVLWQIRYIYTLRDYRRQYRDQYLSYIDQGAAHVHYSLDNSLLPF